MNDRTLYRIWLGWDPEEIRAYNVAELSLRTHSALQVPVDRLALLYLQAQGLYRRPTTTRDGQLYDEVSEAPMTTQHAIARFFVPMLSGYKGWALFTDGDVLFRQDVSALFALANPKYALQVVHHKHESGDDVKKDGQPQTYYKRKNWSSVMLFNCEHPAHLKLTVDELNTRPGRDLHRFCWLKDSEIGELPLIWNYLVNVSALDNPLDVVALAHFTLGTPGMPNREPSIFDGEWDQLARAAGFRERTA